MGGDVFGGHGDPAGVGGFLQYERSTVRNPMALDSDPSMLLITVDTLRRDHVSVYTGSKAKTPVIEELAEEGIVFDNAITISDAPAHPRCLPVASRSHRRFVERAQPAQAVPYLAEYLEKKAMPLPPLSRVLPSTVARVWTKDLSL